jgi:hypothetical protein
VVCIILVREMDTPVKQQNPTEEIPTSVTLEPLDLETVEKVISKYATRHVVHEHGAIIFVGTGGGKSTTCRNQIPTDSGKTDFIDADLVYRETGAHPCKPGVTPLSPLPWWDMGDGAIHEVELRCGLVNASMIKHGLWALTTSFTPEDEYMPSAIVILPWDEQKRRIEEKSRGQFYDGGAKATEQGFSLALGHRKWAEKVAKEKNIPVVDSIDAAIDLVRSREVASS